MPQLSRSVAANSSSVWSTAVLPAILENAHDGFAWVDSQGTIQAWSPVAARLYALGPEEVVGRNQAILVPGGVAEPVESPSAREQRVTIRPPGGSDAARTVALRSHTQHDASGNPIGTLIVIHDITDVVRREDEIRERERVLGETLRALRASHQQLKSTQLQLIQAAKLESMGRIAAGVAHEVKNPLAILLTGTQLLRRRWTGADTVVVETLDDLELAVQRANAIILGLLDFAASTELTLEPANVEEIVTAALHLVRHELKAAHLEVDRQQGSGLPDLRLDRRKIEQVLVNLLINAVHAMPRGGTLVVRTSMRQLTTPGHGIGFRQTDILRVGQTVAAIEIEDSGTGIAEAHLAKVFEPFFTTKAPGKGSGLGLAVCRTIAQLHGGSIWLENRTEGGARGTLVLRAGETDKERS